MTAPKQWDAEQMPSVAGKLAVITGANSGIGYTAALELVRHGAHVVLACRNATKGQDAEQRIRGALATTEAAGQVEFMQLDVSDLSSVRAFAAAFLAKFSDRALDLLINNAGIMAVPHALSVDGIESQFATNHLGHFALTALLFPALRKSAAARIVNLASVMHWFARMKLDRVVTPESEYQAIQVYANTKLYNLLFTQEVHRRLQEHGITNVLSVACHPGYTNTNLVEAPSTKSNAFMRFWWGIFVKLPLGQPVERGALPTLFAATEPTVASGDYYGPDGFLSVRGFPTLEKPRNKSDSIEAAAKLWEESEKLAQLTFKIE